jgi:hypothetical protein
MFGLLRRGERATTPAMAHHHLACSQQVLRTVAVVSEHPLLLLDRKLPGFLLCIAKFASKATNFTKGVDIPTKFGYDIGAASGTRKGWGDETIG